MFYISGLCKIQWLNLEGLLFTSSFSCTLPFQLFPRSESRTWAFNSSIIELYPWLGPMSCCHTLSLFHHVITFSDITRFEAEFVRHGRGNMAPFYRLSRVWSSDNQIGYQFDFNNSRIGIREIRDGSNDVFGHFSSYSAVSWRTTQMTRAKTIDFPRSFKTAPSFVLIAVLQKQWLSSMVLDVLESYFFVFLP